MWRKNRNKEDILTHILTVKEYLDQVKESKGGKICAQASLTEHVIISLLAQAKKEAENNKLKEAESILISVDGELVKYWDENN